MSGAGFDATALRCDYGDVASEARACRADCALFDFSFMHRARVEGRNAAALVQALTPRPLAEMTPSCIHYALRLGTALYVEADITVWRIDERSFEVFSGRGGTSRRSLPVPARRRSCAISPKRRRC